MKRLDRILAERTGFSRSEISKMIRYGRVFVQDVCVKNKSQKYPDTKETKILVDGYEIPPLVPIWVFHKPIEMITTTEDPQGRPCVGDILPHRYHIVGRLDQDTRGLILFSMNGQYTQRLLHPKRSVEREYWAHVEQKPSEKLSIKLAQGVETSVGLAQGQITKYGEDWVQVIMTEGKNRIVRRMLHNAGHSVIDLFRIRFGAFEIGELEEGHMRPATEEEMHFVEAL
jgi:23S rRNA pseudouridine2605 synthase